ncbi:hypothetical protein QZH41_013882 [Actinostola sp. cb2023]|nr:hypothetical protein QZH41_013882 [Actinostola sp. cb2023]
MVIEMAKRKGMIDSPVVKDTRNFANESTKEVFDEWDNNNDGFVDHEEMLYLRGNSDLYLTDEDTKNMIEELAMDKNKDDKISFEEFQEVTADAIKTYFDSLRKTTSRLRSRHSQQTWLWHDEDDLLQYEDLLEDYHDR